MQTQILQPVGQLAKTPIFLLKPNDKGAFRVGRHQEKTLRTSVHTHEGAPAHDINLEKLISSPDLELKTHLYQVLNRHLPKLDLFVHNGNYLNAIQVGFSSREYEIFILLLRLFALQHFSEKEHQKNKIIRTTENNFLQVLRVLKDRKRYKLNTHVKQHHKTQVLDFIHRKIQTKYFDIEDVTDHIYILNQQVQTIFDLLEYEKILSKSLHRNPSESRKNGYSLIKTPFSRVVSR